MKTNWADGCFSFNAAIYRIEWEELQVNSFNAVDFVTNNVGTATSQELELEFVGRSLLELCLSGVFAYTNPNTTTIKSVRPKPKPSVIFLATTYPLFPI